MDMWMGVPSQPSGAEKPLKIKAILEPRGPAAAVLLTEEQVAQIGQGAKTPPVKVTVNGSYTFSGRIGKMGGQSMVGFNKAIRTATGVEPGDEIEVEIVLDSGEREIDVPDDLRAALAADPEATKGFEGLAPSHRKEWARWVAEAKRPETREKRLADTIAGLREGKKRR